jgi:DMATS type aromatic prenyltransferase
MPALGPRPIDDKPYYAPSWLTYDGSYLEYSLNWKEKKRDQTIRFSLEPSSREAGTAADPLQQMAAKDLLNSMAKHVPGIDLERFNLFHTETCVPSEAADEIKAKNPAGAPLSSFWVAFHLARDGGIVTKAYFIPHMRSVLTGIPTKTITFGAIRKCNRPVRSYDSSITVLDDYLETFPAGKAPQVVMLGNDCFVDSPSCRNKVYVYAAVGKLAHA